MESINKTSDPKKYIREYMRKRYAANRELGANISKISYYKRKGELNSETIQKYGELAPYIIKAKKSLDYLKKNNNELFEEFLLNYLETPSTENI
jgi:hypothetical protein